MDKRTFLKELRRHLEALPFEEREDAVSYYEEYLEEAGPDGEADVIAKLGLPKELAKKILAERQTDSNTHTNTQAPPQASHTPQKQGMSTTTKVILLVVTAPITLPILFGLLGAALGLLGGLIGLVFGLGAGAVALLGGGIFTLISAFGVAIASPPTFILFLGVAFAAVGLSVLLFQLTYWLVIWLPRAIIRLCRKPFQKSEQEGV